MPTSNLFSDVGPAEAAILGAIVGSVGTLIVNHILHWYHKRTRRQSVRTLIGEEVKQNLAVVDEIEDLQRGDTLPPSTILLTAVYEASIGDIRLFAEDDISSITTFYNIIYTMRAQLETGDIEGINENIGKLRQTGNFVEDW